MDMDDANESESVARFYSDFEGDFEQTISLLEMNVDEVEIEVQQSFEEVFKSNFLAASVKRFASPKVALQSINEANL